MFLNTIIINRGMARRFVNSLRKKNIDRYTIFLAEGTANQLILRELGISELKKEMIFCMTRDDESEQLVRLVKDEFNLHRNNDGVYFRTPLEYKEEGMKALAVYVIVNRGQADKIIDDVRKVGQTGATVLHGRGSGIEKRMAFFDMVIEPEKDVILFVCPTVDREKIMQTLNKSLDDLEIKDGVIFALPVVETIGFKFDE